MNGFVFISMLFLDCSFNNAAGNSDYVASNGTKIGESIWKEPVETRPKAVFGHLFGVTEEHHNVPQDFRHNSRDSNGTYPKKETKNYDLDRGVPYLHVVIR
jgi:hypothetical protein